MIRWAGLFALLAFLCASTVRAQPALEPPWLTGQSRPEDLLISLVTIGPGDEIYEYFGHAALEVRDKRLRAIAFYDFGTFDYDALFLYKFLAGRLTFRLSVSSASRGYKAYTEEDRDIHISVLSFPQETVAKVAHALAVNAQPEHRSYLYHHFSDNCATRIVDVIDRATGGAFKKAAQGPARMTFREHTRRYSARAPVLDWLIVLVNNDTMDARIKRQDEMFLPSELGRFVNDFRIVVDGTEHQLVKRQLDVHKESTPRKVYDQPPERWPYTLALGTMSGVFFAWLGRRSAIRSGRGARLWYGGLTTLFGLVFGVLGCLLAVLALFTGHESTAFNENLFFVNPLTLGLAVCGVAFMRDTPWARRALTATWAALAAIAMLGVVLKVLPSMDQDNVAIWTLLLPTLAGGAFGSFMASRFLERQVRRSEAALAASISPTRPLKPRTSPAPSSDRG